MVKKPSKPRGKSNAKSMAGFDLSPEDRALLVAIWKYEGVVTVSQLMQITGRGKTVVYDRLAKLIKAGYVQGVDETNRDRATRRDVYWLKHKGTQIVGVEYGAEGDLHRFRSKSEPKWQSLNHDLKLNSIRLQMQRDVAAIEGAEIQEWISEYEFRRDADTIRYQVPLMYGYGYGEGKPDRKKTVIPDGYCYLTVPISGSEKRYHYRLLLELDMATETSKNQFGLDKVLPLSAYVGSDAYLQRFGGRSGLVLVVVSNSTRLNNIKAQTEQFSGGFQQGVYQGKQFFYFTTLEQSQAANIFTDRIWVRDGSNDVVALYPPQLTTNR